MRRSIRKAQRAVLDTIHAKDGKTAWEVSALTGASLRQLQWWDEQKVIRPSLIHSGRRVYLPDDIRKVAAAVRMRRAGVSLAQVRAVLKIKGWQSVEVIAKPRVIGDVVFVRSQQ